MKVNNIMILEGESQYGVMDCFSRELADGFRKYGVNVVIMYSQDLNKPDFYRKLYGIDMIFSFNGRGINDSIYLQEIINRYSIPCWSFMVDHPYYHHTRLINSVYNQIVSVIDRKHLEYLDKYYPNLQNKFFLPHGGSGSEYSPIEFGKKKYEISFFGSYKEPERCLEKMKDYSEQMQELFIKIVDDVWSEKEGTLDESVRNNLAQYKMLDREDKIREVMLEFNFLDDYIRNERRGLLISIALQTGYAVHVFGSGWENFQCENKDKLVIHGEVDYQTSLKLMADSKIVLNNMPLFYDGSHERIFSILASGSICVTDGNPYLREILKDGEDIFYYDWKDIENLQNIIEGVMNGDYEAEKIISSGKGKACTENMWADRARQILEYCDKIEYSRIDDIYNNPIDYDMYSLFKYINNTESDILYEQIKGRYNWYEYYDPKYVEALYKSMNRYRFWGTWEPRDNDYGIIAERVDVLKNHGMELLKLYQSLEDYSSKLVLCNTLLNWVSFSPEYLNKMIHNNYRHYFDYDIISLSHEEVFVDMGAYIGDTAEEFMAETNCRFKKIYCYEFSPRNVEELRAIAEEDERVVIRPYAVGDREDTIFIDINDDASSDRIASEPKSDNLTNVGMVSLDDDIKEKVTFIKSDIEGAEMKALEGAKKHIINDHPKLAISIYHGNYDIYRVEQYIQNLDNSYRFFMRYYGGNLYPAEIVLYAI